jgi:hypothetical protein
MDEEITCMHAMSKGVFASTDEQRKKQVKPTSLYSSVAYSSVAYSSVAYSSVACGFVVSCLALIRGQGDRFTEVDLACLK